MSLRSKLYLSLQSRLLHLLGYIIYKALKIQHNHISKQRQDNTVSDSSIWSEDWICMTSLFSAHGPTLQSLTFFGCILGVASRSCMASRKTNGTVRTSMKTYPSESFQCDLDYLTN